MAKKRLRRKDIMKPDEFVTLSAKAVSWLAENVRIVAMAGGAVLLVFAAIVVFTAVQASRLSEANSQLGLAMAALRANNDGGAASELREVTERWGSTSVAPLARVLAANNDLSLGNPDAAISQFESLQGAGLPSYLKQQVVYGWAAALEQKGSLPAAAAKYAEAIQLSGPYTAVAMLSEARARDAAGETDRASELYRTAYEQFPELPGREVVADRLVAPVAQANS